MKKFSLTSLFFLALLGSFTANAAGVVPAFSQKWEPKAIVSESQIEKTGLENYFVAEPLSEEVFARMQGKSWKKDCPLKRDSLRYLKILYRNAEGKSQLGEMVVNTAIAERVLRIFKKLYTENYRIELMVLVDDFAGDDERSMSANNSSAFNYRPIAGKKKLSCHARGLAIDLNPRYNPYVSKDVVSPSNGVDYVKNRDTRTDIPYKIDKKDLAYRLFKEEGFAWGGDWKSCKDYQHFEFDLPENN